MRVRGEVTVFLMFIFWILLSLIGVMLQSVTHSALQSFSRVNLQNAVNAVGSKYSVPLWEDYHLFMLEGEREDDMVLAEDVASYLGTRSGFFYQLKEKDLKTNRIVRFIEDGGRFYLYEIKEYMKYRMLEGLFEQTEGDKTIEAAEPTKKLLEKKQKTEKNIAALDSMTLDLMHYIEGIRVQGGRIKTSSHFVKILCTQKPTAESVGVSKKEVWKALKDKYIEIDEMTPSIAGRILGDIREAEKILERMEEKQKELKKEVELFSQQYRESEKDIMEEAKQGILSDLEKMKQYVGEGTKKSIYHVKSMRRILSSNREVLEKYQKNPSENKEILQQYQCNTLRFDYSGLTLCKKTENPCKAVQNVVGKHLLDLVAEHPDKLSEGGIQEDSIYFSDEPSGMTSLEKGGYLPVEIAYLFEHFTYYNCAPVKGGKQIETKAGEIAAAYELEYIIDGKPGDRDALAGVAERIVAARAAVNFVYLLTDKEKNAKAYEAAVAAVGFTGMTALIEATKTAILAAWALAEAIVDTALLFRGKKVGLFKSKSSFLVQFGDLLHFGKGLIEKKCSSFQKSGEKTAMDYAAYLKAFLLAENPVKRRNRSLGVIEANIKCGYDTGFSIGQAIYSFSVEGEFLYSRNEMAKISASYAY